VLDAVAGQQRPGFVERFQHRLVGRAGLALVSVDGQTGEQRHMGVIAPVLAHGLRHLDAVGLTQAEVVLAMAGGDVDEARTGVGGDEIAGQQRHLEVVALAVQRVAAPGAGEARTGEAVQLRPLGDAGFLQHALGHAGGEHQTLADHGLAAFGDGGHLEGRVFDLVAIGDGAVGRQGPGGGRPDDDAGLVHLRRRRPPDGEAGEDGGGGVVVVFDLGIGQRGLLDHRPHHRLGALVEAAVHRELVDFADDLRLGREGHGGVGVLPVALHAQPAELGGLDADPFLGELAAFGAELDERHVILVLAGLAVFLLDLPLDGQAVAVPAGDIVGVEALHLAEADDDVLQDLVDGVADVDVAVGIGRAVVQHELLAALGAGAQLAEQVHLGPALQQLGLLGRQAAAHGEVGARQKDGRFVIAGHIGSLGEGVTIGRLVPATRRK